MDFEKLFTNALLALLESNGGSLETALDTIGVRSKKERNAIKKWCNWEEE